MQEITAKAKISKESSTIVILSLNKCKSVYVKLSRSTLHSLHTIPFLPDICSNHFQNERLDVIISYSLDMSIPDLIRENRGKIHDKSSLIKNLRREATCKLTFLSHICNGLLPILYNMDRKPDWKVFLNIMKYFLRFQYKNTLNVLLFRQSQPCVEAQVNSFVAKHKCLFMRSETVATETQWTVLSTTSIQWLVKVLRQKGTTLISPIASWLELRELYRRKNSNAIFKSTNRVSS